MKVLVACEFSGVVRDAFIAAGHDAVSYRWKERSRTLPQIAAAMANQWGTK